MQKRTADILMLIALPIMLLSSTARADDDRDESGRLARDRVLKSVQSGEARPLAELKQIVLKRWPGELLEVDIEDDGGVLAYTFKVVTDSGRLTEIEIDAGTGRIIEVENE